jgi:hypothetical protein
MAYSSTFGVNAAATAAPPAFGFLAVTQTATLTAAEANYAGSFTSASSCANVTVAPASSATGAFTITAVSPTSTACTVTITGATGQAVALSVSVPKPAGVVLRWYTPQASALASPVPQSAGPINIVGLGASFAPVLQISEQNYIGGFAAANVVTSAPCAGAATIAALNAAPTGLPTAAPGTSLSYYTVTGAAGILTTANCTITVTDSYVPVAPATANPSASIGVSVTTTTGTLQ